MIRLPPGRGQLSFSAPTFESIRKVANVASGETELTEPAATASMTRCRGKHRQWAIAPLDSVGPVASPVRCLGIADQVAQKLHACTGPAAAGRARDVFEERATHAFPPRFVMLAEWRPELEALAAELDFPLKTSAAIERRFLEVIQKLSDQSKI